MYEKEIYEELERCKRKPEDVDKANCIFDLLHDITRIQDVIQLSIPPINESVAISKDIINNANAIILETSKEKGNLESLIRMVYLKEKIRNFVSGYNALAHDFNITNKENVNLLRLKEEKEDIKLTDAEIKDNKKVVFGNYVFDYAFNKWKKLKNTV
ncbi:MAG: hypothetical protein DRJ35_08320 [Thermoprotei archaeon]|nr:MAG: hypothetical protein DRJ35_08320 [Thermoprotei archaeon]